MLSCQLWLIISLYLTLMCYCPVLIYHIRSNWSLCYDVTKLWKKLDIMFNFITNSELSITQNVLENKIFKKITWSNIRKKKKKKAIWFWFVRILSKEKQLGNSLEKIFFKWHENQTSDWIRCHFRTSFSPVKAGFGGGKGLECPPFAHHRTKRHASEPCNYFCTGSNINLRAMQIS